MGELAEFYINRQMFPDYRKEENRFWRNKSMSKVTGVVESKSRAETGIKVDGKWYNGSKQVLASVNWKDTVELEVDSDGKKVISAKVTESTGSGSVKDNKVDWDARQDSILWQSARKDAVNLIGIIMTHHPKAVTVPTTVNKQYGAIVAAVDVLTRDLFDKSKTFNVEEDE